MAEAVDKSNTTDGQADNVVVELLRAALTDKDVLHERWTPGVVNLSGPEATLFYERQGGTSSSLRLGSNTTAQVVDLSNACQPATFGLNQKEVLDETYRKAGKLDAGNFLWGFNADTGNFASKLASGLFLGARSTGAFYLGFGLTHAYPLESALFDSRSLNLKGSDATLVKALREANIEHDFFLLYREKKDRCYCPFRVLSTATIHGYIEPEGPYYESVFEIIACGKDSFLVWDEDPEEVAKNPRRSDWYGHYVDDRKRFKLIDVKWVTEPSEECVDWSTTITYGNEPSLGDYYHQLCLIATFPPVGGRPEEAIPKEEEE